MKAGLGTDLRLPIEANHAEFLFDELRGSGRAALGGFAEDAKSAVRGHSVFCVEGQRLFEGLGGALLVSLGEEDLALAGVGVREARVEVDDPVERVEGRPRLAEILEVLGLLQETEFIKSVNLFDFPVEDLSIDRKGGQKLAVGRPEKRGARMKRLGKHEAFERLMGVKRRLRLRAQKQSGEIVWVDRENLVAELDAFGELTLLV